MGRMREAVEKRCKENSDRLNKGLKLKKVHSMLGTRVHGKWWVSTTYRNWSNEYFSSWDYETFVFKLKPNGSWGETIYGNEYGYSHAQIVEQLFEHGRIIPPENEEEV